jgi:hypothetical protein
MYSFLMNPWAQSEAPYYLAAPSASGAAASPQGSQGLIDLFALFNDPNVRAGMAYSYGQDAVRQMGGGLAQATKDKLDYARTVAGSMPQHSNVGGNVPAPQLRPWSPATILQLMQLLGSMGASGGARG